MRKIDKEELHEIFKGIKSHNELAFNELYEKYGKLVYAVSFSILKNKENSEDIVQKVFMKLWKIEKDKLPTNNEASWLYSMTKNETLNFLRNQKEELNIDEVYYIMNEDKELNEIIEKDSFNKIISRLNEKEQEIVSLKILSDLSFREISQVLNIPIGTVQWKYYKSLHTLKTLLGSLSAYIVTIIVFITQREKSKIKMEQIKEEKPKQEDNEEKQEANKTEEAEDSSKKEESVAKEIEGAPKKEESTTKEDESALKKEESIVKEELEDEKLKSDENDIVKEPIQSITKETEDTLNLTALDIGLLSISSIFLITTIIFLIFFIKHQQKAKKKVSK